MTNKVFLMRSICSLKLEEGDNAKAHINHMQDLFTILSDIGETTLTDKWSAAMLLSSLPESYDALITTLESRKEDEVTFALVQQRVIAEYERHSTADANSNDSVLKIIAKTRTCFFCKKPDHMKKNCPKYKEWRAKRGSKTNKGSDKVNSVEEQQKGTSTSDSVGKEFLFKFGRKHSNGWMLDSGATRHAVRDKSFFTTIDETHKSSVEVANGELTVVKGIGSGNLMFIDDNGNRHEAKTTEVLYAPDLVSNILSIKRLPSKGFRVEFSDTRCEIKYKGKVIGIGDVVGSLYILRQCDSVHAMLAHNDKCIHQWHRKMGHRHPDAIRKMASEGTLDGLEIVECGIKEVCEVCMKGKMTRIPFPQKSTSKLTTPLDLIHTDVCGSMQTITPSG